MWNHGKPSKPSLLRLIFNTVFLALSPLMIVWVYTLPHFLICDILIFVVLSELNIFRNKSRCSSQAARGKEFHDLEKDDPSQSTGSELSGVGVIVGRRENPIVFRKALQSYNGVRECKFLFSGVDGNESEDQEMVRIFQEEFPTHSATINIHNGLGEYVTTILDDYVKDRQGGDSWSENCQMAYVLAEDKAKALMGPWLCQQIEQKSINRLCIYQQHNHLGKKEVIMTSMIFGVVIARMLGTKFLWCTDSDSWIVLDTLEKIFRVIDGDPTVGGASCALAIHNENDSITAKLGAAIFWYDMLLTRGATSALGSQFCQNGPGAAFRVSAVEDIMVDWYLQEFLGRRIVVNDDRHLTTRMLLHGWKILFVAESLVWTDCPSSLYRWINQQIRWQRTGHIENWIIPEVYLYTDPIFFLFAFRDEFAVPAAIFYIFRYIFQGGILGISSIDGGARLLVCVIYAFLRNPAPVSDFLWLIPGYIFSIVTISSIKIWSALTFLDGSWSSGMRSFSEVQVLKKAGFRTKMYGMGHLTLAGMMIFGIFGRLCVETFQLVASKAVISVFMTTGGVFGAWIVYLS